MHWDVDEDDMALARCLVASLECFLRVSGGLVSIAQSSKGLPFVCSLFFWAIRLFFAFLLSLLWLFVCGRTDLTLSLPPDGWPSGVSAASSLGLSSGCTTGLSMDFRIGLPTLQSFETRLDNPHCVLPGMATWSLSTNPYELELSSLISHLTT